MIKKVEENTTKINGTDQIKCGRFFRLKSVLKVCVFLKKISYAKEMKITIEKFCIQENQIQKLMIMKTDF